MLFQCLTCTARLELLGVLGSKTTFFSGFNQRPSPHTHKPAEVHGRAAYMPAIPTVALMTECNYSVCCACPQVPTGYTFMAFSATVLSGSGSMSLAAQGMKVGEGRWWPRHT